jgi:hypothetical protein
VRNAAHHTRASRAGTAAGRATPSNLHDRLSSCYHVACFNLESLSFSISIECRPRLQAGASIDIASTDPPDRRFSRFVALPGHLPERRTFVRTGIRRLHHAAHSS